MQHAWRQPLVSHIVGSAREGNRYTRACVSGLVWCILVMCVLCWRRRRSRRVRVHSRRVSQATLCVYSSQYKDLVPGACSLPTTRRQLVRTASAHASVPLLSERSNEYMQYGRSARLRLLNSSHHARGRPTPTPDGGQPRWAAAGPSPIRNPEELATRPASSFTRFSISKRVLKTQSKPKHTMQMASRLVKRARMTPLLGVPPRLPLSLPLSLLLRDASSSRYQSSSKLPTPSTSKSVTENSK